MKKTLLRLMGRIVFWLGWPVLYFYLRGTTRTRVVIAAEGRILVAKGWLGDGKWELPGGGTHDGENVSACALREVKEETGIILKSSQLIHGEGFGITNNGINFRCEPFFVRLQSQPSISPQKHEIAELLWLPSSELDESNTESASLIIITDFKRQSLL